MEVSNTYVSTWMHLNIKVGMFEQLSKPLKVNGIHISLLVITFLTYVQNVATSKLGKMIIHCFCFKNLSLNEEI